MANHCCSIEMEPRTLKEGQLNHAREVAANAVEKMELKQASTMFIKGLRPADQVKQMDRIEENEERQDDDDEFADCEEKAETMLESQCQCSIITSNKDSPDLMKLKEPLSAPF